MGSGLPPGHSSSLEPPPGWVGVVPTLTWSPTHWRSHVLWASTHRLGLSWLGHTPGWLPGPCSRLAPEVSPTMRRSGRSSLGADMGTTGPGAGVCGCQCSRPRSARSFQASTLPGLWSAPLTVGP